MARLKQKNAPSPHLCSIKRQKHCFSAIMILIVFDYEILKKNAINTKKINIPQKIRNLTKH